MKKIYSHYDTFLTAIRLIIYYSGQKAEVYVNTNFDLFKYMLTLISRSIKSKKKKSLKSLVHTCTVYRVKTIKDGQSE